MGDRDGHHWLGTMIEGVPWPAVTAASGGWLLAFILLFGLITGRWIVSRREADTYLEARDKAERNVEKLLATNAELTAMSQLQKATIEAALRARDIDAAARPPEVEGS